MKLLVSQQCDCSTDGPALSENSLLASTQNQMCLHAFIFNFPKSDTLLLGGDFYIIERYVSAEVSGCIRFIKLNF